MEDKKEKGNYSSNRAAWYCNYCSKLKIKKMKRK